MYIEAITKSRQRCGRGRSAETGNGLIMRTIGLLAILGALLVPVGNATASSASRAAYAERVEPICQATTPEIERLLEGTRRMANHGRAVAAGRRFVRASNVFAGTVKRVARVRRPASEATRLAEWVDRLRDVKERMRGLGLALKHRDRLAALNRVGQMRDAGTFANRVVAGFPFDYCRIYASRFN
jgi:hypothetical protein